MHFLDLGYPLWNGRPIRSEVGSDAVAKIGSQTAVKDVDVI